ncbi:hypothetical protein [Roseomonas indoligenes]|uniref:Glycosyltransferase RgtA/B/C/D-like domain-containing protein n=1 Tax=Roseomonas indoligenes TaxID=2820811 RepID=A0A940S8N8_9PROT|nr:hypothetical protein [Pararoseomonas indoligenes]MBP0496105.1 hypothetical protein [Pararoseomonas indoligenes]
MFRLELLLVIPIVVGTIIALMHTAVNAGLGETGRAALSFLRGDGLSNPYMLPTGPTAHVSPIHTAYLAGIFALLGENTATSRVAQGLVCVALWVASTFLSLRIAARLGLGQAGRWTIVLLTCVTPFYLTDSVLYYRQWDQPFAAFLLVASLAVVLRARAEGGRGTVASAAGLAGIGGLVSPAVLPAMLLGLLTLLPWREGRRAATQGLLAGVIVAACLVPWGIRNSQELGVFTMTRSNFGLELAVGNNDLADGTPMGAGIHPFVTPEAARRAAEVGEAAYMREMRDLAMSWIREHPGRFVELSATRAKLLLFPREDMIDWRPVVPIIVAWIWFTAYGAAKLLGTLLVVWRGPHRVLWLAYTVLPLAPYILTHVTTRYGFVVFFPTACLIGVAVDNLARRKCTKSMRGYSGPPSSLPKVDQQAA